MFVFVRSNVSAQTGDVDDAPFSVIPVSPDKVISRGVASDDHTTASNESPT